MYVFIAKLHRPGSLPPLAPVSGSGGGLDTYMHTYIYICVCICMY